MSGIKPMPDDLDSGQQLEDEVTTDQPQARERRSFGRFLLEDLNPFEAVGELFAEPELGKIVLLIVALCAGIGLIGLIGWCLWAAVHEAFLGGGPPQGLGLK